MRGGWIFFFKISKRDFTFIREMRVPELRLLYLPLSVHSSFVTPQTSILIHFQKKLQININKINNSSQILQFFRKVPDFWSKSFKFFASVLIEIQFFKNSIVIWLVHHQKPSKIFASILIKILQIFHKYSRILIGIDK